MNLQILLEIKLKYDKIRLFAIKMEEIKRLILTQVKKIIDDALPFADYKISILRKNIDISKTEGRVDFLKKAAEVLRQLSPVEADIYIKKLAQETRISEGAIRLEMNGNNSEIQYAERTPAKQEETQQRSDITMLEKNILKLILQSSKYFNEFAEYSEDVFKSESGYRIFSGIGSIYSEGEAVDIRKLADQMEPAENRALQDIIDNVQISNESAVFRDCIEKIKTRELSKKEKELIMRISMAEEEENIDIINELTQELMRIQKLLTNR